MSATASTPWGPMPLTDRPGRDMRIGGIHFSFPADAAPVAGTPAGQSSEDSHRPAGNHFAHGGTSASRLACACARNDARPAVAGPDLRSGLSDFGSMLLAILVEAEARDVAAILTDALAHYAEATLGLPAIADGIEKQQGRAAVARLAHNQEVVCSNRTPATSVDCAHGERAFGPASAGARNDARPAVAGSDLRSGEPPP